MCAKNYILNRYAWGWAYRETEYVVCLQYSYFFHGKKSFETFCMNERVGGQVGGGFLKFQENSKRGSSGMIPKNPKKIPKQGVHRDFLDILFPCLNIF